MIGGLAATIFIPPILQDQSYHRFADGRSWRGIPNFGDVASNLPFVIVGALGLLGLGRFRFRHPVDRVMWGVFFTAQLLTGLGSAWYHAAPDDARLVWDRLPLTVVIMSLVAIVASERVSPRFGWMIFGPLLMFGLFSIQIWHMSGDLRLYAVVQFGAILCLPPMLVFFPPAYTGGAGYAAALGFYALAKVGETFDAAIFHAAGHAVSGHTLKHLLAGAAGASILAMVYRRRILDS
jgi:hypothetical protein